jgi:transcriptional regulator with XRE-family HTH domain
MIMALKQRKTRLGHWRNARRISQEELAHAMHVTGRTIRNWETGITTPTPSQALSLSSLLGVHVRELFPFTIF